MSFKSKYTGQEIDDAIGKTIDVLTVDEIDLITNDIFGIEMYYSANAVGEFEEV